MHIAFSENSEWAVKGFYLIVLVIILKCMPRWALSSLSYLISRLYPDILNASVTELAKTKNTGIEIWSMLVLIEFKVVKSLKGS